MLQQLHTIPARVSFRFLKESRLGSEGDSFEHVHWSVKTKGDVSPLDLASLRTDDAELEEGMKAEFKICFTSTTLTATKYVWHFCEEVRVPVGLQWLQKPFPYSRAQRPGSSDSPWLHRDKKQHYGCWYICCIVDTSRQELGSPICLSKLGNLTSRLFGDPLNMWLDTHGVVWKLFLFTIFKG